VLLLQLELPVPIVERAAEMARSAGSRVVLDAAPPRAVADSLVRQLDVVRANAGEARALTGVEVEDFSSARAAADALLARGAGAAVGGAVAHRLRSRSDTGGEQERHAPCTLASVWGYVMQAVLGRHSGIIYALMRLMVGLLFACHGAQKLLGFPNGQKVALGSLMGLAGVIELVGGLMVAAGLFAGPVAFICSGEMAAAYFMAHFPKGFWPILNQGELAVVYCFVFLYIASRGSGAYGLK
jgi:putative oxidoreductase